MDANMEAMMTISDYAMILAVILGPILAVQTQKWIESWRADNERKKWIFKTLMATRGTPVSPTHVQALNMIELEFSIKDPQEKAVLEAWRVYLDHLSSGPTKLQDQDYHILLDTWSSKSRDFLVDLLHTMGKVLKYDFDKVQLKKGAYTPQGHAEIEFEQAILRKGTIDILAGRRALPVEIKQPKQQS